MRFISRDHLNLIDKSLESADIWIASKFAKFAGGVAYNEY
jgi:hypothetical protein